MHDIHDKTRYYDSLFLHHSHQVYPIYHVKRKQDLWNRQINSFSIFNLADKKSFYVSSAGFNTLKAADAHNFFLLVYAKMHFGWFIEGLKTPAASFAAQTRPLGERPASGKPAAGRFFTRKQMIRIVLTKEKRPLQACLQRALPPKAGFCAAKLAAGVTKIL